MKSNFLKIMLCFVFVFSIFLNTNIKSHKGGDTTFSLSELQFAQAQDPEEGDQRVKCYHCVDTYVCITISIEGYTQLICEWETECTEIPCE